MDMDTPTHSAFRDIPATLLSASIAFWKDVFAAAIQSGQQPDAAADTADKAIPPWLERMWPVHKSWIESDDYKALTKPLEYL